MNNALVRRKAQEYGIPFSLAQALIGQESGGNASAVSSKGATGLTQVMPGTAAGMYGISEREAARRLRNPRFALDAGFRYLAAQKKTFGTWTLALAAYNAGPGAVRKYGGIPPYEETQNYVKNILGRANINPGDSPTPASSQEAPGAPETPQVGATPLSANWTLPEVPDTSGVVKAAGEASASPILAARPAMLFHPPTPEAEQEASKTGGTTTFNGGKIPRARNPQANQIINLAARQIGQPYVWGGESRSEGGLDCSGLIQWAYGQAGISLPRTTGEQINVGKSIGWGRFRPGDLIFANGGKHVVMYVGNGMVIAAPHTGAVVRYQPVTDFKGSFAGARRII